MIEMPPSLFIEIMDLFKNPSLVRNLLFPNRYEILEPETNKSSNKHTAYVYDMLDLVKSKVGYHD